jgi:branched-chain amino acid transport system permease protein
MSGGGLGRWRRGGRWVLVVGLGALAIVVPDLLNPFRLFIATLIVVFATAAVGLVVIMGWTGQIALAHVAFMGIGAYVTNWLFSEVGAPWVLALILAAVFAAAVGAAIGYPAARLRGFYLAIATLAFAELIFRLFVEVDSVTGGIAGTPIELIELFGIDTDRSQWYMALILASVVFWSTDRLGRSAFGRSLRAVRDAEIATGSLGISATRFKLIAFALSGLIAALAGGLFGQLLTFATPDTFHTSLLIQFLVVVFVGGVTRLSGAVVGAIYVIVSRELLQDVGEWQRLVFGLSLMLAVRFLPGGITSLGPKVRQLRRSKGHGGPSTRAVEAVRA